MRKKSHIYQGLSRRERQIMDVIYADGEVSARHIHARLPDPPGYSSVRALLSRLVDKNVLRYRAAGRQYLYAPVADRAAEGRGALRHLLDTFFQGSAVKAASALLGPHADRLSDRDLEDLRALVDQLEHARREGACDD